jgi:hypothetical protein
MTEQDMAPLSVAERMLVLAYRAAVARAKTPTVESRVRPVVEALLADGREWRRRDVTAAVRAALPDVRGAPSRVAGALYSLLRAGRLETIEADGELWRISTGLAFSGFRVVKTCHCRDFGELPDDAPPHVGRRLTFGSIHRRHLGQSGIPVDAVWGLFVDRDPKAHWPHERHLLGCWCFARAVEPPRRG